MGLRSSDEENVMGSPGYVVFCHKGHIVESCGHHEMIVDEAKFCDVCGSCEFKSVMEWGDPDYNDNEGSGLVPFDPIGKEKFLTDQDVEVDIDGVRILGKLVIEVNVYDVTRLFGRNKDNG